jgi:2-methylcitrate dehydratase PrpD
MAEAASRAAGSTCVRLAEFIVDIRAGDLPEAVIGQARRCLIDAAGCLVGAHRSRPGEIIGKWVAASGEHGDIRIPGSELKTSLSCATVAAAHLINALDYDDIYTKGHPGATVNSVVFTLGQALSSSDQEIIEAVVAGYEVSCRAGIALIQTAPRKEVHGHGTWQTFGAAAAAAKLMRLNSDQSAHALALAAANAPVPSVMKTVYGERPTMAKNNFGTAAWAGLASAQMAAAGFEGPLDVFEGDTGFWRMSGADGWNHESLLSELGQRFELLKVGFKAYPTCRIVQSSVQAAVELVQQTGIDVERDLESLEIAGPEILTRPPFSSAHPATIWEAQFSVPYAVALGMLTIEPGPQWFEDRLLADPRVKRLAALVAVGPLSSPDRQVGHFHSATATLRYGGGKAASNTVRVARGEYPVPLSYEELIEKAGRLTVQGDPTGWVDRIMKMRVPDAT